MIAETVFVERVAVEVGEWPADLAQYVNANETIPGRGGEYPEHCPNCGGMKTLSLFVVGRYIGQVSDGSRCKWLSAPWVSQSGWYTGEYHYGQCPVCCAGNNRQYITSRCGLFGKDLEITPETFKAVGPAKAKAAALTAIRELLADGRNANGFLTLVGDYGVGKSHLLKAMVNGFRLAGIHAQYTVLSDLVAQVRDRFGDDNPHSVEEAIAYYRGMRVLAIDELDRTHMTGWTKELIHRLLDRRYNERASLLTVMATNLSPDKFEPDMGYLASRCTGGQVIEVPGPDMRPIVGGATR